MGLLDSTGALVVEYSYDAWGKPTGVTGSLAGTLGKANPLRYRRYVWDEESGLYYLKSRYYRPEWGRFISADSVLGKAGALLAHNVFAYCRNKPVGMTDTNGMNPLEAIAGPMARYARRVSSALTSVATKIVQKVQSVFTKIQKALKIPAEEDAYARYMLNDGFFNGALTSTQILFSFRGGANSFIYVTRNDQGSIYVHNFQDKRIDVGFSPKLVLDTAMYTLSAAALCYGFPEIAAALAPYNDYFSYMYWGSAMEDGVFHFFCSDTTAIRLQGTDLEAQHLYPIQAQFGVYERCGK